MQPNTQLDHILSTLNLPTPTSLLTTLLLTPAFLTPFTTYRDTYLLHPNHHPTSLNSPTPIPPLPSIDHELRTRAAKLRPLTADTMPEAHAVRLYSSLVRNLCGKKGRGFGEGGLEAVVSLLGGIVGVLVGEYRNGGGGLCEGVEGVSGSVWLRGEDEDEDEEEEVEEGEVLSGDDGDGNVRRGEDDGDSSDEFEPGSGWSEDGRSETGEEEEEDDDEGNDDCEDETLFIPKVVRDRGDGMVKGMGMKGPRRSCKSGANEVGQWPRRICSFSSSSTSSEEEFEFPRRRFYLKTTDRPTPYSQGTKVDSVSPTRHSTMPSTPMDSSTTITTCTLPTTISPRTSYARTLPLPAPTKLAFCMLPLAPRLPAPRSIISAPHTQPFTLTLPPILPLIRKRNSPVVQDVDFNLELPPIKRQKTSKESLILPSCFQSANSTF